MIKRGIKMEQKENLYQMFNQAARASKEEERENVRKNIDTENTSLSVHEYLIKLENQN